MKKAVHFYGSPFLTKMLHFVMRRKLKGVEAGVYIKKNKERWGSLLS